MTLLGDLVEAAANAPSAIAATDRATTGASRIIAADPSADVSPPVAAPRILACSPPPTGGVQSLQAKLLAARRKNELLEEIRTGVDSEGYPLCQFRKGFLDHLQPRSVVISTLRVSLQQATTILVTFISEQLELDLKRNVQVNEGQLTQLEADVQAEEWEKIEWDRRWKTFPHKFLTALVKYHAVTLIIRSYEFLASKIVNLKQLDKLTTDPFAISRRIAAKAKDPPKGGEKSKNNDNLSVSLKMTQTTLWANLLPFFADYTLHQGLLCYGYFKYYRYQRQKRLADVQSPADADEQDSVDGAQEETALEERRALTKDLATRSSRLAANRGLGWFCSGVGAGIGSVVWAGWGTIVVSALGDAAAGAILDDGYHKARTSLEEQQRDEESRDAIHKAQIQ